MAKKSFKDNPALQFISTADEDEEEKPYITDKTPEGYKMNPLYVEKKSRRVQLVVQPSLYDKIKKKAATEGLSVNECIHRILEDATREY